MASLLRRYLPRGLQVKTQTLPVARRTARARNLVAGCPRVALCAAPSRSAVLPALCVTVHDGQPRRAPVLVQWTPVGCCTFSNCPPLCHCCVPGLPVHVEWLPGSDCSLHGEHVDLFCIPVDPPRWPLLPTVSRWNLNVLSGRRMLWWTLLMRGFGSPLDCTGKRKPFYTPQCRSF